jgi:hypothetical protein
MLSSYGDTLAADAHNEDVPDYETNSFETVGTTEIQACEEQERGHLHIAALSRTPVGACAFSGVYLILSPDFLS